MRNGFEFKDIHSSFFGVSVRTKSRPIRPSAKTFLADVPCRDGSYDFSASNPYGREFYNDRIFTVSMSVYADNMVLMQKKLTQLSNWLCGKGELIFDDMPLVKWTGRVSDEIIYMPEHEGRKAVIEVTFSTEPFSKCIFDSADGPCLDIDAVLIGDNLPIGIDEVYTYTVSGSADLAVMNVGDRYVRPVIEISGNASALKLSLADKSLSFTASGDVTVDFEKQSVTDALGTVKVSGMFFEFMSGENILHIENSNTDELTVKVHYTPGFMYNLYFDDMNWGDVNA